METYCDNIRRATEEDLSRIAEILVFVKRIKYRPIFKNDAFSFGELQVLKVAEEYRDPAILGNMFVYDDGIVKGLLRIEGDELRELYVDWFFQGQGVGSALIEFAKKEYGVTHLWTLEKNTDAIEFYKKHGFRATDVRRPEEGTPEFLVRLEICAGGSGKDETGDMDEIRLVPLQEDDREQFILDNQEAFNYGALEEFGMRDDHFEEEGEIISRETIEASIDSGEAYRIMCGDRKAGGAVIRVEGDRGDLELLFVSPEVHSKGIGHAAWCAIEKLHPEVRVWETVTPYFEKRNIHFYVNRCGFHIVEFFNSRHPDPNDPDMTEENDGQFPEGMFRFEKIMF